MPCYNVTVNGKEIKVLLARRSSSEVTLEVAGKQFQVQIEPDTANFSATSQTPQPSSTSPAPQNLQKTSANELRAPMPGVVVDMLVKKGESVTKGQQLCILEAMKMENAIAAPKDGVIADVLVAKGTQVETDQVLIIFEKE